MKPFYRWIKPKKMKKQNICLYGLLGVGLTLSTAYAGPYDYSTYGSSYNTSNNASQVQPKIRWYRYYNSNGQPSLSSTITEQHLKYGYEALDRNMQVVKRVPPYSAESYAQQKAKRDAMEAKRQAALDLRRTYGSVAQATAKRDQLLADIASRKNYLQSQLVALQKALSHDIAQAASFERQNKPIPAYVQTNLENSRKSVDEAQQNIRALTDRDQQIRDQYADIIRRLNEM